MPLALSIAGFDRATPPWLRPAAIALATCVHVLVLIGLPWPRQAGLSIPTPLELQVIPQGLPAEAVIPLDLQPAAQVRPSDATPGSAPTAETRPVAAAEVAATAPAEQAAVNPAERLADAKPPKEVPPATAAAAAPVLKPSDAAPVAAAAPAPERPATETLAATEPARQQPALPPAPQASESKPSELTQAAAPAVSALPASTPEPASPTPPPAELKAFEVARAPSSLVVAQPARELPAGPPMPPAINVPIQASVAAPTPVAEAGPTAVAPAAAPVASAPPARELPASAPTPPVTDVPIQASVAAPTPVAETGPTGVTPAASPVASALPAAAPAGPLATVVPDIEAPAALVLPPAIGPSRQEAVAQSDQRVTQLIPLEVTPPSPTAGVAAPMREMQSAVVETSPAPEMQSAVVVTSPGREVETAAAVPPAADLLIQNSLARPEQPIAESRPTVAATSAAPAREMQSAVVGASPGREVETAAALPPAADPLIQNSLARPEQPIAESRPTEAATSAAPARVLPPREPPAPAATVVNPRNETPRLPAQQAASELKPFDVAQAAAPVQVAPTARDTAPTARETPPAEAAPLAPQLAPALEPSESIEAQTVPVNIAADDPAAVAVSKYRDAVYAELNRHKRYPEAARQARITGAVLAAFTIGTNGQVSAITITRSSGHASLDGAVRQLLGALALPPPPAGPIRVAVPVEFKFSGF